VVLQAVKTQQRSRTRCSSLASMIDNTPQEDAC
jgi:hypothetical protein